MKIVLELSIAINILFVLIGVYVIHKKGGVNYLKKKFNIQKETDNVYFITRKSIYEKMPNDTSQIVFLGESITDFCDWHELFGKKNIINRGIAGDDINNVIDRLNGILESNPQKIFLMIGINDLARKRSIDEILFDYEKLINIVLNKAPKTQLFLQSILPTKNKPATKNNDILEINKGITEIAKKYSLTYVNLFDLFKTNENELNMDFSFDGLHINGKGYVIWKNAIIDYIEK